MAELLMGALEAASFDGLIRALELGVMVYMLKILRAVNIDGRELYDWHNQNDPDNPGRKIWWNNPEIAKSLKAISSSTAETNQHLIKLVERSR